jgi:hypothetical protein
MTREGEIEIDVRGQLVRVPREVVHGLAAAAAARAGISSRHRDLSLLLRRALDAGRVSLSRAEARALRVVLEEDGHGFGAPGEALLQAASSF